MARGKFNLWRAIVGAGQLGGVTHQLERSDNLDSWTNVRLFDPLSVSPPTFAVEVKLPLGFYRLRALPPG